MPITQLPSTGLTPTADPRGHPDALCAQVGGELFFPEKGGSSKDAIQICDECDVSDACLSWALSHDERYGIWGGTSERERRRLQHLSAP